MSMVPDKYRKALIETMNIGLERMFDFMIELNIRCYIKNKLVYKVNVIMSKEKLLNQLKENKLVYKSMHHGGTEIVYLDKFDKLEFDKDIDLI